MRRGAGRWLAGGLLVVLLALGGAGPECGAPGRGGPYSVLEADRSGALGLLRLTEALGHRVERFDRPLAFLPDGGALVMLCGGRGAERPFSVYERRRLRRWVRDGGRLLSAGCDLRDLFGLSLSGRPGPCLELERLSEQALARGEEASRQGGEAGGAEGERGGTRLGGCSAERDAVVRVAPRGPFWEGLGPLPVVGPASVRGAGLGEAEVLAVLPDGAPFAVRRPVGRGEVWLLGSAEPFLNGALSRSLGAARFARWLRALPAGAVVRFDAWRIGEGSAPSAFGWLGERGAGGLLVALLLAAVAGLWRSGSRPGPPLPRRPPPPDATASLLEALQGAYRTSGDREGLARRLRELAVGEVAAAWRLPGRDPARLAERLRAMGRREEARALERMAAMGPPEQDWPAWLRRLEEMGRRAMPPASAARRAGEERRTA